METKTQVLVTQYGYSSNPTYDALMHKLSELAGEWRTTKHDAVVQQYHAVLDTLMVMGWRDELPVDIELPERLMPEKYLAQFV